LTIVFKVVLPSSTWHLAPGTWHLAYEPVCCVYVFCIVCVPETGYYLGKKGKTGAHNSNMVTEKASQASLIIDH
jgi:hypothetical protein